MRPSILTPLQTRLWWVFLALGTVIISLMLTTSYAFADATPQPQGGLAFDSTQTYVAFIGSLIPLATYVLNRYAPWADEKVKAIVQVVVAAIVGGLYQALSSGIGFNVSTLQIVGTSVFAALIAHKVLWAPSTIAAVLGGNTSPSVPVLSEADLNEKQAFSDPNPVPDSDDDDSVEVTSTPPVVERVPVSLSTPDPVTTTVQDPTPVLVPAPVAAGEEFPTINTPTPPAVAPDPVPAPPASAPVVVTPTPTPEPTPAPTTDTTTA